MDLSSLTEKSREKVVAVQKLIKEDPRLSIQEACKQAGITNSYYHNLITKIRSQKKPRSKKIVMHTFPVEEARGQSHVVAFVGSAESVVQSIKELMR